MASTIASADLDQSIAVEQPSLARLRLRFIAAKAIYLRAYQEGVTFQLLQVDVEAGFFVVRVRGEPGRTIQQHKHRRNLCVHLGRFLEVP